MALLPGVLLAAGCGRDPEVGRPFSTSATLAATVTSAATSSTGEPGTTVKRGSPRWETVVTLRGSGPAEPPRFPILADSIQWRARWSCEVGGLRITTDPPPRRGAALVEASCPGQGDGYSIVTGSVALKVDATGPWQVIVDQQVDTALSEPPFEGMATAPVLRQGSFYPVEKEAKGSARLYRRADGATVLRFDDFEVSSNVDLFVWVSEAVAPKTSAEAVAAPHVVLGNLKSSLGSLNYVLPPDLPLDRVRSVVVWCEPIQIAYGAAALDP